MAWMGCGGGRAGDQWCRRPVYPGKRGEFLMRNLTCGLGGLGRRGPGSSCTLRPAGAGAEPPRAKCKPAAWGRSGTVGWGGEGLPHERTVETAAGKIIKGLTAILVGHLLFNQSVSSISCSPEALSPKFLCLLQHMVAGACHEKLIILQEREILFIWVPVEARPSPGLPPETASQEWGAPPGGQGGTQLCRQRHPAGLASGPQRTSSLLGQDLYKQEYHQGLERCGFKIPLQWLLAT